jgi:hypothetical protein
MRLLTVAALTFSGLAVSAKFVQPNATEVSSLFAELSELPSCAVRIHPLKLASTLQLMEYSSDDLHCKRTHHDKMSPYRPRLFVLR